MDGGGPIGRTIRIRIPRKLLPLVKPARYKGIHGGRGGAKSHTFGELLIAKAEAQQGLRWACLREVQQDLKQSVKLLLEDKIRSLGVAGDFGILKTEIRTPGGGLIIFKGMNDFTAQSIKSLEGFDGAWFEEAHTASKRSLELLIPTIRKDGSEIWASWNPTAATDAIDVLLRGPNPPPDSVVIEVNLYDNPWLPDVLRQAEIYDRQHNPIRHGHIWLGDYEPQAIGAIWSRSVIADNRRTPEQIDHPLLPGHMKPDAVVIMRIVVAIDPATEAEEDSDENGIIVAGLGNDGHAYVLEDASIIGTPAQWASRAIEMYDKWGADLIVAEINQGGQMVRHTLDSVRTGLPISLVRAKRGKHLRAEPIAALYDTPAHRVHHVGTFEKVENQMCLMTAAGYEGTGSPDRLDALVYAITELVPPMGQGDIYQMPLADFTVKPQEIPGFWPRAFAMHVDGERCWVLWCAIDRGIDCMYVYTEHHRRHAEPSVHAAAVKVRGDWIPGTLVATDRSANVVQLYRTLGLRAIEPFENDVEAGIAAVWARMSTGRLKVVSTCADFAMSYRLYRRDEQGRPIEDGRFMSCLADLVRSGNRIATTATVDSGRLVTDGIADLKAGY
ncbi:phage terminase large subunit [Thalassobaculum sp.]|uniref:phage terminase large subunit n=1 Tax=Thalassobaculum sp. TaxID=2022740 RepID=UPI0032EC1C34